MKKIKKNTNKIVVKKVKKVANKKNKKVKKNTNKKTKSQEKRISFFLRYSSTIVSSFENINSMRW